MENIFISYIGDFSKKEEKDIKKFLKNIKKDSNLEFTLDEYERNRNFSITIKEPFSSYLVTRS